MVVARHCDTMEKMCQGVRPDREILEVYGWSGQGAFSGGHRHNYPP